MKPSDTFETFSQAGHSVSSAGRLKHEVRTFRVQNGPSFEPLPRSAGSAERMSKNSKSSEASPDVPASASPLQMMAQVQLRSALREVRRHLKKVEDRWKKDPEPLHQARVFARRSQVCLELFHPLFSEQNDAAWISARLRELLKSSGKARDLDVLLSSAAHKGGSVSDKQIRSWQKKRKECQPEIEAITRKLQKRSRFKERSRALIQSMEDASRNTETSIAPDVWASQQIHQQIERLLTQVPASVTARTLHKFRLGTKQTRYAADCIGEMVDCPAADELSELLADVQKELGNIQDAVVAQKQRLKSSEKQSRKGRSDSASETDAAEEGNKAEALAKLIQKAATWIQEDTVPRLQKVASSLAQNRQARRQPETADSQPSTGEPAAVKAVARRKKKQPKKEKATV